LKASLARFVVVALAVAAALATVPRAAAGRDAGAWLAGDLATQDSLARTVMRAELDARGAMFYRTGADRFDGQSAIAIHQMTLLGLGQILLAHPEKRAEYLPAMRRAAEALADPATLAYAAKVYGHHGVVAMRAGEGHAYLGYINLGLGMLRLFDPAHPLARVHDRITDELARRLDGSPTGMIETYPGETWPPDVAAVAGSIGLHARATGVDRSAMLARWAARFEACAVDRASGMLVQRLASGTCTPVDAPRGSGTAVASYFLAFAAPELSRTLYASLERGGALGFAGVREYARGRSGPGDTNAGPIVFGMSVGASGFALGAARVHGDGDGFRALYRSTRLLGMPTTRGGALTFTAGGALGNALLLAMLTARVP
jgi:hypothetical protein